MSAVHCALENGVDLYVHEHQKIRHYRARSTEERRKKEKKNAKSRFFYFSQSSTILCSCMSFCLMKGIHVILIMPAGLLRYAHV